MLIDEKGDSIDDRGRGHIEVNKEFWQQDFRDIFTQSVTLNYNIIITH